MSNDALTIASTFLEVRRALDWVSDRIGSSLFDGRRDDIALAAAEALNNIVRHGYREATGGRIDLELRLAEAKLTLVITDNAPLPPPQDILAEGHDFPQVEGIPLDEMPESGFGLALIQACTDNVTFERLAGGNLTVLEFLL